MSNYWLLLIKCKHYTHYQFEKINIAFLFASLFGKLCLAMVMYLIVYKFRFIYFVITKSLSFDGNV